MTLAYGSAMADLSVFLPPALEQWVASCIATGRYVDASDYVRDLVRRDKQQTTELRALIEEGLASGVVDAEPETVLAEIIAEVEQPHG